MAAEHGRNACSSLGVLVATGLLAGCAGLLDSSSQTTAERARAAQQQQQRAAADEHLRRQAAAAHDLELKLARAQLALLEREAQLRAMQEKLDLATLEVVRAMAKLRGMEGKAEAAANFAEAEIALRLLEKEGTGRGRDPDLQQAKHLMKLATEEFQKQNYAGTIYLTGRVKALSSGVQLRAPSDAVTSRLDGEASFSVPLPLRAVGKSNVREGPAFNQKVAFVIEDGAVLTGYSQKDLWVRVTREDGRSGWIFYTLISLR